MCIFIFMCYGCNIRRACVCASERMSTTKMAAKQRGSGRPRQLVIRRTGCWLSRQNKDEATLPAEDDTSPSCHSILRRKCLPSRRKELIVEPGKQNRERERENRTCRKSEPREGGKRNYLSFSLSLLYNKASHSGTFSKWYDMILRCRRQWQEEEKCHGKRSALCWLEIINRNRQRRRLYGGHIWPPVGGSQEIVSSAVKETQRWADTKTM